MINVIDNNNYYSSLSDEELMQMFNQIAMEKNRLDWAYYYICVEIEARKKKIANPPAVNNIVSPKGGFNGESQFQKRTDEIVKKELKKEDKTSL